MTPNKTSLVLLSVLAIVGCTQSPAGAKTRNLESEIQGTDLADSDVPADSYTRHLAIQGAIAYGDSVDGHYASGAYAAWLFTASANAHVAIDASATDGTDTVIALYGPQTASSWTGARPLAVNDDYRGSTNSHIDHRVSRAGTYLVVVREYSDAPGAFTLTLACSGSECRQECGTADRCPTGSECHRIECIRAPCPSYCQPTPVAPPACPPNTRLCINGSHYDGTPGVCACVPDAVACGGRLGNTCTATQFCSFTDAAMCGFADATGVCTARPQICPALFLQVCGCNGQTYGNYCYAQQAGTSVLHTGACTPAI